MFKYKRSNLLNLPQTSKPYNFRGNSNHLNLIEFARNLRRRETTAEARFWNKVRGRSWRNLKFRRQHQIGEFIVDFYCDELRLIIELDGGIHLNRSVFRRDKEKEKYLASININIVRVSNGMILNNVDEALIYIEEKVAGLGIKF